VHCGVRARIAESPRMRSLPRSGSSARSIDITRRTPVESNSVHPWSGVTIAIILAGASVASAQTPVQGSTQSVPHTFASADLVSDVPGTTPHVDPALVNAWGVACSNDFEWVADAGTGKISIIDRQGNASKVHIFLPSRPLATEPPAPTGIVINSTHSFYMMEQGLIAPAYLLVATEEGTIAGWNPGFGTQKAFTVVDNVHQSASYKGIALSNSGGVARLYATDFHNGRVDMFGNAFQPLPTSGLFVDPTLPPNYVPFGIQAVGDFIVVTYAYKTNPNDDDETEGAGLGIVSVFAPDGTFVKRLATGGDLNAPWGIAAVGSKFSGAADTIVIGNFGDGKMNVFHMGSGQSLGQLLNQRGQAIAVDGLWGIAVAPRAAGAAPTLFYAGGPADESHGVFGEVKPVQQ
jgi:uncharacterized protein (TIGR03118 family)